MLTRRAVMSGAASLSLAQVSGFAKAAPTSPGIPAGTAAEAELESLPGKGPLIRLSYRPPNYEAPIDVFREAITPNDRFFVRYHLADIPEIDASKYRLNVGGTSPISLSLDDLKAFPPAEVVAVCQCSGNRRGLSSPHVAGVEWGLGAMGNARWKGARLKDVLARAGLPKDAVELVFNGADGPVNPKTPDFQKSLPVWKATDENTIIAYEMNGHPLPHWNGYPARLIVPGWTATYWMKHLVDITPSAKPFDGFWMKAAYRVPTGLFPSIDRFISQETLVNTPITDIMVNSIITMPTDGSRLHAGQPVNVTGIAWDGGRGVDRVMVSIDDGKTWSEALLGEDLGRYSFRQWSLAIRNPKKGRLAILARASNKAGQTQVLSAIFNPAGYHHNVAQRISVEIV